MPDYFIGLISGTSMDGVDTVLLDLSSQTPRLVHQLAYPLPEALMQELRLLSVPGQENELERVASADIETGKVFAAAVAQLLQEAEVPRDRIRAIGSHGQTIRHRPDNAVAFTVQIGDPNVIAEETGITTIADFRRRDMAAGGQGAPMVPAFHNAVFRHPLENRVVVNIGGIANITVLPRDPDSPVYGYDTGPGNTLMDQWMQHHLGQPRDDSGQLAANGTCEDGLLKKMLTDPYFQRPAPKSTGREYFTLEWLNRNLADEPIAHADLLATLCELSARSIADEIARSTPTTDRILVCGGGSHNPVLMSRLQDRANCPVETTDQHGIAADWVEAMAFAWLARQTLERKPGNLPTVTGAEGYRVLGGIYQP